MRWHIGLVSFVAFAAAAICPAEGEARDPAAHTTHTTTQDRAHNNGSHDHTQQAHHDTTGHNQQRPTSPNPAHTLPIDGDRHANSTPDPHMSEYRQGTMAGMFNWFRARIPIPGLRLPNAFRVGPRLNKLARKSSEFAQGVMTTATGHPLLRPVLERMGTLKAAQERLETPEKTKIRTASKYFLGGTFGLAGASATAGTAPVAFAVAGATTGQVVPLGLSLQGLAAGAGLFTPGVFLAAGAATAAFFVGKAMIQRFGPKGTRWGQRVLHRQAAMASGDGVWQRVRDVKERTKVGVHELKENTKLRFIQAKEQLKLERWLGRWWRRDWVQPEGVGGTPQRDVDDTQQALDPALNLARNPA